MSEWYKVALTQQQVGSFQHVKLQNAFQVLLMANGGRPPDAALFTHIETTFPAEYFFSPSAVGIAKNLIEQYLGTPCQKPNNDELALVVGTAQSRELIFGVSGD
jgi:hypothetical protein